MRKLLPPLLCALLLLPAIPIFAADTPATPVARKSVSVDLRGRTITGVLPFDIPFDLTGPIPETVDRVDVHYAECPGGHCPSISPDSGNCGVERTQTVSWKTRRDAPQSATVKWHPDPDKGERELSWTRDPLIDKPANDEKTIPFVIGMPMLEAQREFTFVIELQTRPAPSVIERIRAQAATLLREEIGRLAAQGNARDLTTVEAEAIQKRIVDMIHKIEPCIRTSGALSREATSEQVRSLFLPVHLTAVNAEQRIDDDLARLNETAPQLRDALAAIRGETTRTALAALPDDAANIRIKTVRADLLNLGSLSSAQFAAIARGSDPSEPDTSLGQYTQRLTAVEMQRRADALDKVRSIAARANEAFAATLENNPPAAARPALQDIKRILTRVDDLAFGMSGAAKDYARNIGLRDQQVGSLADVVDAIVKSIFIIGGSSIGNFDTNQTWYVSADAGMVWGSEIQKIVPYIGTNIYFRPVNRDTPLSLRSSFGRRFALTLALTAAPLAEDGKRADLFGNQSLLFGFGYRATDAIRIGAGTLIFQKQDPNPLISHKSLGRVPYISISFDWNVVKQFSGIGKLFTGT